MTDTKDEVLRVRASLTKELDRVPRSTEIAAEVDVSAQRVRQILAEEGLQTYKLPPNRVDLEREIEPCSPIQRRIVLNLRRLYRDEVERDDPRTDTQMAIAAGYTGNPARSATEMRRYFYGDRNIGIDLLVRFAEAFGVDPVELLRPIGESEDR